MRVAGHNATKNCKSNPNCVFGLGENKQGIWSSNFVESKLGYDLNDDVRKNIDAVNEMTRFPTGLKNLGATCYINSLLQSLFMNQRFRAGVYQFKPPASTELSQGTRALQELQRMFAHMQVSQCILWLFA